MLVKGRQRSRRWSAPERPDVECATCLMIWSSGDASLVLRVCTCAECKRNVSLCPSRLDKKGRRAGSWRGRRWPCGGSANAY
eukprot:6172460-Pleurochrysis_carterae.AAC.1